MTLNATSPIQTDLSAFTQEQQRQLQEILLAIKRNDDAVLNAAVQTIPATAWASPGTIGSTTPNTGAFTTLQASGLLSANGGLTSTVVDLTAAAPSTPTLERLYKQTIPKAWVYFTVSGGACTIGASFNVSSVTYNSTGKYTPNFATTLNDANYSWGFGLNSANANLLVFEVNGSRGTSSIHWG